jgi:hypothetical protein
MQIGKFTAHLITPTPLATPLVRDGRFAFHASAVARAA